MTLANGSITDSSGTISFDNENLTTTGTVTYGVLNDGSNNLTTTVAELNILDGNTSATSTTLADADRVVVNDAGTMKQVALTDFETYFESSLDTLSSVTTVGALNSGSITSGFGEIDNGSSAITTTGTITYGTLNDGSNNLTSTVAELNILDGNTSAISTTLADADRVVVNDGGTMKQVALTDFETYFESSLDTLSSVTTVGALNNGSITSGFGEINNGSSAITTTGTITYGTLNDGTNNLTTTVEELNILDGGTSATSTTLVDADRVVVNDGGTMKQVALTDFETYFESSLDTLSNVTTVGALNSGSITSGFGVIDNGSSSITTTGTITYGTLNDGSDNLTTTVAELNVLDGNTSATSTTLADADRLVVNDAGTMNQVALTDFKTYFEGNLDTLSSVTTVGALNNGSITSGFGAIDNGSSAITTTGTITYGTLNDGDNNLTTTVAELNILDGGTNATFTTLVDADRVVVNDGGTMKQVALTDFETYFEGCLDTLSSVTTVGALNNGSITSGFGSIDNGSSAITTSGTITYGTLNDGSNNLTSTIAELNILDGNTSATSTTLADVDRVVVNDGGTMKQVALTDFETYFEGCLDTLSSVTTVGALNNGSITSGFGEINNGSSAITTTGTITYGVLNDGSNNLTTTVAELNILDGGTSAISTTLADADRVVVNDGGTMKQVALTDFETYFESSLDTLNNVTTVGDLNGGSITSGFGAINNGSSAITTTGTITYGVLNDGSNNLTTTVAELNILDGGTSAISTTLADADRVVVNDGGTMKQVALTDFETYFESSLDTLNNVTTVGDLNGGSITSGFGDINNGSSAITTTGTVSSGGLNLSSAASINFGSSDITLAHNAGVGLTLTNAVSTNNKPIVLSLKSEEDEITSGEEIGRIDFTAGDSDENDAVSVAASIAAVAEDTFAADNNSTGLAFKLGVSAAATEMFRMDHDGDFKVLTDGSAIAFGADNEIELTHVHNTGLLLTDSGGSPTLQFHDSNEAISSDGAKLILTSGGVDFSMPTSYGDSGQQLTTDGSGNLSWAAAGSGGGGGGGGGVSLTGSTNNTICTVTGTDAIAGEANFTFDTSTNKLSISSANTSTSEPLVSISNSDTGPTSKGELRFVKDVASENGEDIGQISFYAKDAGNNTAEEFASILGEVKESTNGTECGQIKISTKVDGTTKTVAEIGPSDASTMFGIKQYLNKHITVQSNNSGVINSGAFVQPANTLITNLGFFCPNGLTMDITSFSSNTVDLLIGFSAGNQEISHTILGTNISHTNGGFCPVAGGLSMVGQQFSNTSSFENSNTRINVAGMSGESPEHFGAQNPFLNTGTERNIHFRLHSHNGVGGTGSKFEDSRSADYLDFSLQSQFRPSGSTSIIRLASGTSSSDVDDFYNGLHIEITNTDGSGSAKGIFSITAYNGSNRDASISFVSGTDFDNGIDSDGLMYMIFKNETPKVLFFMEYMHTSF